MTHKLKWYSHDGKTANLVDCIFVNQRLAGTSKDARINRNSDS